MPNGFAKNWFDELSSLLVPTIHSEKVFLTEATSQISGKLKDNRFFETEKAPGEPLRPSLVEMEELPVSRCRPTKNQSFVSKTM